MFASGEGAANYKLQDGQEIYVIWECVNVNWSDGIITRSESFLKTDIFFLFSANIYFLGIGKKRLDNVLKHSIVLFRANKYRMLWAPIYKTENEKKMTRPKEMKG